MQATNHPPNAAVLAGAIPNVNSLDDLELWAETPNPVPGLRIKPLELSECTPGYWLMQQDKDDNGNYTHRNIHVTTTIGTRNYEAHYYEQGQTVVINLWLRHPPTNTVVCLFGEFDAKRTCMISKHPAFTYTNDTLSPGIHHVLPHHDSTNHPYLADPAMSMELEHFQEYTESTLGRANSPWQYSGYFVKSRPGI